MSNAIDLASSFAVKHCNGYRESGFATYDDALKVVKEVYKGAVIGHDGDITDGGVTTLCWEDEESSVDDDGSRAVCTIIAMFE